MDIYEHELGAYKNEILTVSKEYSEFESGGVKVDNLTHYSLAMSNRINLLTVGLCSLVEIFMYELAHDEDSRNSLKLEDTSGQGLSRFKSYLSSTRRVDFGTLRDWGKFTKVYDLRNSIVHSYGGLVETRQLDKVKKAVKALNIEHALVGNRRIRLSIETITDIHTIINNVIKGLRNYA